MVRRRTKSIAAKDGEARNVGSKPGNENYDSQMTQNRPYDESFPETCHPDLSELNTTFNDGTRSRICRV